MTGALWSWLTALDPRIWQAVVAGAFVALGWVFNGWQNRREATRLRAEKLRDAHKALFAEIRDICATYWLDGQADLHAAALMARMEEEPEFVPFVPQETRDRVFGAILPQIDVLPRQTIDSIVAFYALVHAIQMLAQDMRGDKYTESGPQRRLAVYRDYIGLRTRAFSYGQSTLRLIGAYSDGGPKAAERMLVRLSSRDGGRSFPAGPDRG